MFWIRRMGIVALVALAATGSGADAAAQPRINSWTTPHVLTISDGGDLNTLNVHLGQNAVIANLSEMTMAWLIRWDEHNRPYPELATAIPTQANGGVSADGLTITYHLRKGVVWSDGAPFTADDVVFSTNVVNDPANDEASRLGWNQIVKIDEPDKYTVVYHMREPFSPFLVTFFSSAGANPCILPKHLLAKYPNINNVPYNYLPIGIGPFKYERWDRERQVILVANPRYWRGRPRLDKIVYKIVPNRDALLGELQTHRVDMWYQFGGAYLARIQSLTAYTVVRQPSYAYNHLDFNLTRPAVADPNVREALRLALDRQALVDDVAHGVGIVQDSATPVTAPYYTKMTTTPYDPTRANALLDGAGWVRGSDGIRAKNGVELKLDVAIVGGQADTDAFFRLVRDQWNKVGVDISLHRYPAAAFFAPAREGGVIYGNSWDVVSFAWAADVLGDYSGLYGCDQFPPDGLNDLRWCNQTAQEAMKALYGHYEQSQRNEDVSVLMHEFVKDVPSIVSAIREDLFAYNKDLKNYRPNNVTPFDNMMEVDI